MVFFPTAVLVGVDGTRESRHAVVTAAELCQATDAGIEPAGVHVRYGENVERELVRLQTELSAGLLVVGEGAAGNLASRIFGPQHGSSAVQRSTGSVLVVRPPEGLAGRQPDGV